MNAVWTNMTVSTSYFIVDSNHSIQAGILWKGRCFNIKLHEISLHVYTKLTFSNLYEFLCFDIITSSGMPVTDTTSSNMYDCLYHKNDTLSLVLYVIHTTLPNKWLEKIFQCHQNGTHLHCCIAVLYLLWFPCRLVINLIMILTKVLMSIQNVYYSGHAYMKECKNFANKSNRTNTQIWYMLQN